DVGGLVGSIHHYLGDGALAEGHGHLDLTDALGGAGVGAGGVDGPARGRRAGGSRVGPAAGRQGAGGHADHGCGGRNCHKGLAGNLAHFICLLLWFGFLPEDSAYFVKNCRYNFSIVHSRARKNQKISRRGINNLYSPPRLWYTQASTKQEEPRHERTSAALFSGSQPDPEFFPRIPGAFHHPARPELPDPQPGKRARGG